jgi:hypothetical protein
LTLNESASELPDVAPLLEQVATGVVAANDGEAKACPCSTRPRLAARASDRGYLPIELEKYLSLLHWTGRELRAESRGAIPGRLSPMLHRLGLNGECWLETVREAAGSSERLADENRWRPPRCVAVVTGSRGSAPRRLPFSDYPFDAERLK